MARRTKKTKKENACDLPDQNDDNINVSDNESFSGFSEMKFLYKNGLIITSLNYICINYLAMCEILILLFFKYFNLIQFKDDCYFLTMLFSVSFCYMSSLFQYMNWVFYLIWIIISTISDLSRFIALFYSLSQITNNFMSLYTNYNDFHLAKLNLLFTTITMITLNISLFFDLKKIIALTRVIFWMNIFVYLISTVFGYISIGFNYLYIIVIFISCLHNSKKKKITVADKIFFELFSIATIPRIYMIYLLYFYYKLYLLFGYDDWIRYKTLKN
ncbi:hypothetical protein H311_01851 [Anncaliia algerae PRA109]|nr:hypothetical protein H311_01851 [Anncaliia algerae PRA109]